MPAAPLKIDVFDRNFRRTAVIGAPKFATVIPRHNKVGSTTVGLLATDNAIPRLFEEGSRLRIRDEFGEHLMSGYVTDLRGRGPGRRALVEVDIQDDLALLTEVVGWVIPTEPISNQGIAGTDWTMTGPAETVLKTAMQVNAIDRLGLPLTIAPDQGRGAEITAKIRFEAIYDRIVLSAEGGAGLENAGIGVSVRQQDAGLLLDVYEPRTYPRTLTESSGVVTDWAWTRRAPKATRVAVKGQGEAQARVFRYYVDEEREELYGRKIERARDARDVDDVIDLPKRGQLTLDEGAPTAGVSLTLSQTKNFRYGNQPGNVRVGDTVPIGVAGQTFTERMDEATLSWTEGEGFRATPKIGERVDSPDTLLAKAVRSIARRLSNQNRM